LGRGKFYNNRAGEMSLNELQKPLGAKDGGVDSGRGFIRKIQKRGEGKGDVAPAYVYKRGAKDPPTRKTRSRLNPRKQRHRNTCLKHRTYRKQKSGSLEGKRRQSGQRHDLGLPARTKGVGIRKKGGTDRGLQRGTVQENSGKQRLSKLKGESTVEKMPEKLQRRKIFFGGGDTPCGKRRQKKKDINSTQGPNADLGTAAARMGETEMGATTVGNRGGREGVRQRFGGEKVTLQGS